MDVYSKILQLAEDGTVKLADNFKQHLGTRLKLGMSNYVIENGTLSDGHECLTPAQRYYQAIKEMYGRSQEVKRLRVKAMEAQANLIDSQKELDAAVRESDKLRAEAHILSSETQLEGYLVSIEDTMRQINAFDKIRKELQDYVEKKYPKGLEQAEPENWEAVAKYRHIAGRSAGVQPMKNVPLPPEKKAELGLMMGRHDMMAPLFLTDLPKYQELEKEFTEKLAEMREQGRLEHEAEESKQTPSLTDQRPVSSS